MKGFQKINSWNLALILLATSAWITACDGQNISQSDPSALALENADSPEGECPYAHKRGAHRHGNGHGHAPSAGPCDCDKAHADCPMASGKVDRKLEVLDNGIQISLTTSDPNWVEKLQSKAEKMAQAHGMGKHKDLSIKSSVVKLENGARVIITSDDPAAVEKLQTHASHMGEKPCGHHQHGHNRHPDQKQVAKQIEEIENGVRITMTTQEPAMVEKIQKRAQHKADKIRQHHANKDGMKDMNLSVENLDNGAVLTWTSADPETSEKIKSLGPKETRSQTRQQTVQLRTTRYQITDHRFKRLKQNQPCIPSHIS